MAAGASHEQFRAIGNAGRHLPDLDALVCASDCAPQAFPGPPHADPSQPFWRLVFSAPKALTSLNSARLRPSTGKSGDKLQPYLPALARRKIMQSGTQVLEFPSVKQTRRQEY